MHFLPFRKMLERVDLATQDSDTSLFLSLTYYGELVTKFAGAALVSAVLNDKDRHRYSQLHRLVRADGIGEWAGVIDAVLAGPSSQFLQKHARIEQRELTQKCKPGLWQHESVRLLNICLKLLDHSREELPSKIEGRRWFALFAELRNKTKGHGALDGTMCSKLAPALGESLNLITTNTNIFRRPWVYLQRNLSGKYRVTRLSEHASEFEYLKSDRTANLADGIYTYFDRPTHVELLRSTPEANDFFVPNGGFNNKKFEVLSYITGSTQFADASSYLFPSTELPPSETEGLGTLDVYGDSFGNLPPIPTGYVTRSKLEEGLGERLSDERHPVITLAGRGGIGKTSLALATLHKLCLKKRFEAVLWFSARDIDLLQEGPKVVKTQILTESDIAGEFVRLLSPPEALSDNFDPLAYLSNALQKSPLDGPILFAIDNFETVRSPAELFLWLDTYVRPPNKILITTRFRDFKGDYPVDVLGMTTEESQELITSAANKLGIRKLLTQEYRQELIRESDGHPYVIKILLGEVAKARSLVAIKRIVASRDEILDALFERTFTGLSPAGKRVFFLLSKWRSTIPEIAIQAVLTAPGSEQMDVDEAIDELSKSSLIETSISAEGSRFLSVPLVAAEFGKRKLSASSSRSEVEADIALLQYFGPGQKSDVALGLSPRIKRFFKQVGDVVKRHPEDLERYIPILEFIGQRYSPAWLEIAQLFERAGPSRNIERAKEAVRRYLEQSPNPDDQRGAWNWLAELCQDSEDWSGELHARVGLCELPNTEFEVISDTANRLNHLFAVQQFLETAEKSVLVQKVAGIMDSRLDEADGQDHSRLAWLYLHLNNPTRARIVTDGGLSKDPWNEHLQKLQVKLVEPEQR